MFRRIYLQINKDNVRYLHDRKLPEVIFSNYKTNKLIGVNSPKKADYSKNNSNKIKKLSIENINKQINRSEYDDNLPIKR